jgi:hypothetical protein
MAAVMASLATLLGACGGRADVITPPPKPVYVGIHCVVPTAADKRRARATHAKRRTFVICRGRFDARRLLGMQLRAARQLGSSEGFALQSTIVNGRRLLTTADYRPNRVDIVVRNGRIVGIHGVG